MFRRWFKRPDEYRFVNYTNAAVDSLLTAASGGTAAVTGTAAVEACVAAISRPFALAEVQGGDGLITPALLVTIARQVMTAGNYVALIDLDGDGLFLRPAGRFEVGGRSARAWVYELELPLPSGNPIKRRSVASGVIHIRVGQPAGTPWNGKAPWESAALTSEVMAGLERSLKYDVMSGSAIILPMPDGASQKAITQMKSAITAGLGHLNFVETVAQGFGAGLTSAPKKDWEQSRIGPNVPEFNLVLRVAAEASIFKAYGVADSYFGGDGNGLRESRRQVFLDAILPLGEIIALELSEKLETPISIDFQKSEYLDAQRLSRSYASFVAAGMSPADAANILGLDRA